MLSTVLSELVTAVPLSLCTWWTWVLAPSEMSLVWIVPSLMLLLVIWAAAYDVPPSATTSANVDATVAERPLVKSFMGDSSWSWCGIPARTFDGPGARRPVGDTGDPGNRPGG